MDRWKSFSVLSLDMSPISWSSLQLQQPQLFIAIIGLAFLLLVFFLRTQPKDHHRLPPGPPAWPIIGNLHQVSARAHLDFQRLAKTYGPIMHLRLGSKDTVVVSSPKIAEEILKTHDIAFSSRRKYTQTDILYYGGQTVVTAPYGPFWRHAKKVFTLELLTNRRIEQYQNVRKEEVSRALRLMIDNGKVGKTTCLIQPIKHLLMNTFTRMMMKKSYFGQINDYSETDENEAQQMANCIEEQVRLSGEFMLGDYVPLLKLFDLQRKHKMRTVAKSNDKFFQKIIDERRRQQVGSQQQEDVMDMLDILLTRPAGKEEKPFTDAEIKGMLMLVVLAGSDTASETVEWGMTQLLKNPHVMKKAQDELDAVVGRDRLVEEADIPNLKYLGLIVKEILRLHPAVPVLIPHLSIESRDIAGYHVPVNTQVYVNTYAIQRDPEVWERPLAFDPERFLSTNIDIHGQDFELLPFGTGRRSCPGKALAMVLVNYMLATFLHACSWTLPPGVGPEDIDFEEAPGFGLHKLNSVEAIASPRLPMDVIFGSPS